MRKQESITSFLMGCVFLGVLALSGGIASAAIIANESFLTTGTGAYSVNSAGTTPGIGLRSQPNAAGSSATGFCVFDSAGHPYPGGTLSWWHATGVVYVFQNSSGTGLTFPDLFTENNITAEGAMMQWRTNGTENQARTAGRGIDASLIPESGSLYFRFLMRGEGSLASQYRTGSYAGVGLSPTLLSNTQTTLDSFNNPLPTTGTWVAFHRPDSTASLDIVLRVNGTDYTLVDAASMNTTYICTVEFKIGAGTDGAELIRAFACPVNDYTMPAPWNTTIGTDGVVEAEVFGSATPDNGRYYMWATASYLTGNQNFLLDEFRLATSLGDVVPSEEGLVLSNAAVSEIVDDKATLSVDYTLRGASANLTLTVTAEGSDTPVVYDLGEVTADGTATYTVSGLEPAVWYTATFSDNYGNLPAEITFSSAGGVSFADSTLSGTPTTGLTAATTITTGAYPATVEVLFGNSPTNLVSVQTWSDVSGTQTLSYTLTDNINYGSTYYAVFQATVTPAETPRVFTSETLSRTMPLDIWWTGSANTRWSDPYNWDAIYVPDENIFTHVATSGTIALDTVAAVRDLIFEGSGVTSLLDFQTGSSLTFDSLYALTGTSASSYTLRNGQVNAGAITLGGTNTTSRNSLTLDGGSYDILTNLIVNGYNPTLTLTNGVTVNVGAELRIGGNQSHTIVVAPGSTLAPHGIRAYSVSTRLYVDGVVSNTGTLHLGDSNYNLNGDRIIVRKGGYFYQNGAAYVSVRGQACGLYVEEGGTFYSPANGIQLGGGSDGYNHPSGSLSVSNGVCDMLELYAPYDTRYGAQRIYLYGDTVDSAKIKLSRSAWIGSYTRQGGNHQARNNRMIIKGGTFEVGQDINLGNSDVETGTNNVISVEAYQSRVTAANITLVHAAALEFVAPETGSPLVTPLFEVSGTVSFDDTSKVKLDLSDMPEGTLHVIKAGAISGLTLDQVEITAGLKPIVTLNDTDLIVRLVHPGTSIILR